jgi:hypothetical protein
LDVYVLLTKRVFLTPTQVYSISVDCRYKVSLVLLVVAACSALPQFYPYQAGYPGVYPGYYHSYYPVVGYPAYPGAYPAATRNLITLSNFQASVQAK